MKTLSTPNFRFVFAAPTCLAAATFLLLLFVLPSWVLAQGKLRRVRKSIRKVEAPAERPSEKPKAKVAVARNQARGNDEPRSNHSDNHNNGARKNKRRPTRHGGYNPPHATAPVVVFHQTHGHFPAPCFSDPVLVAGPVIEAERPVFEPSPSRVVAQPALLATVPVPAEYEVVSEIDQVGVNWFEATDSRIWANVGSDFDGIFIGSLGANLQIPRFLGVDTSLAFLRERGMDWRDHLWLGDANVTYQIVNLPRFKTRVGVGVNFMGDRWGSEYGVNLTAGVDLNLNQRWTIVAEGDVGSLGDADFSHGKAALNRRFQGTTTEWTIGYERYSIGDVNIDSTFTGLQVRF